MLFNFAQVRDGNNVKMKPHFWIKVTGAKGLTVSTAGGPPTPGSCFQTSPLSVEYRARGYSNLITSQLGGKVVNGTLASGGQGFWTLASSIDTFTDPTQASSLTLAPTDTTMLFSGGTFYVSIYGEYGKTPDTDPTGDANQFITSYKVTLPGQTLPVPIAPRWNTRQAPNVWYPSNSSLKTYPVAATDPWSWAASEMVPWAALSQTWNWVTAAGTPSWDITDDYVRDDPSGVSSYTDPSTVTIAAETAAHNFSLDSYGSRDPTKASNAGGPDGREWMPYAFKANVPPASVALPLPTNTAAAPLLDTPWLASIARRISANTDGGTSSIAVTSEGAPLSTGTSLPLTVTESSLFSVASDGGAQTLEMQGAGRAFITPYDVVVSALVDPQVGNIQGDPRLVNSTGELGTISGYPNGIFNSSQSVYGNIVSGGLTAINSPVTPYSGLLPSQMFNLTLNQQQPSGVTYGVGKTVGAFGYPRMTAGAQFHELGSQNTQLAGFETGYHIFPWWGKTVTKAADRKNYFALEGAYGVYNGGTTNGLGSNENLSAMIRLDTNVYMQMNPDWDWTSQEGNSPDGGYVERPDQDYQTFYLTGNFQQGGGTPYFSRYGIAAASNLQGATITMFAPNRQIPSPVVLGTLSSSMTQGWQTLAFSPNPASVIDALVNGAAGVAAVNPGVASSLGPITLKAPSPTNPPYGFGVPDHLLLDLFWMPVAEPYPISEQFSTSGKINLNYAMMPFPYIQRKTGLDAVLKSVMIYAISDTNKTGAAPLPPQDYKSWSFSSDASKVMIGAGRNAQTTRYPVNVDATLNAFDYKFLQGDIFRSATQICDMFLYPNDPGVSATTTIPNTTSATPNTLLSGVTADLNGSINSISKWWNTSGRLTSDNGREAPYNAIYSRITTQSNTYTVHWKVQALHQIPADATAGTWNDNVDRVVSELRGSTLIERYIDPNAGSTTANSLPDYANSTFDLTSNPPPSSNANPITYFYKWRVDNQTYFQPGP